MKETVETAAGNAPPRRSLPARFARDRRGVAALEFGMVSIPFLGLLCAIFETAFVVYTHEVFDNTVTHVARQILANQYPNSQQSMSSFISASGTNGYSLCGGTPPYSLPSYFICSNIRVNITTVTSNTFGGVAAITDSFITNPQATTNLSVPQAGDIVVFQAYYPMPIYLSVLLANGPYGNQVTNLYGAEMVHNIFSVAVFRNEPPTS